MAVIDEVPKSRINLTYRTTVSGVPQEVVLPFRILIMGDLSKGTSKDRKIDLDQRQVRRLDGKNLSKVLADMDMKISVTVPNRIDPEHGDELMVEIPLKGTKSFEPREISQSVPKIKSLLVLKKLLLEAQANLDNRKQFRNLVKQLAGNSEALQSLKTELQGFETFKLPAKDGGTKTN